MSPSSAEPQPPGAQSVLSTAVRILTFRATREELQRLDHRHLVFGLVCTWIVGIGRYYDNERVGLMQHLGIGSIIYVLILSLFLWLLIWPLAPKNWSFLRVAAFVSLVSPPAILYAIPVEQLYSVEVADTWNALFLAVVSVWRVALLTFLLRRLGQLPWPKVVVATLLPLCLIVVTLAALNLERVVLEIMGGFKEQTASDASYFFIVGLSYLAIFMLAPLLLGYIVLVVQSVSDRRRPGHWPEWMDE